MACTTATTASHQPQNGTVNRERAGRAAGNKEPPCVEAACLYLSLCLQASLEKLRRWRRPCRDGKEHRRTGARLLGSTAADFQCVSCPTAHINRQRTARLPRRGPMLISVCVDNPPAAVVNFNCPCPGAYGQTPPTPPFPRCPPGLSSRTVLSDWTECSEETEEEGLDEAGGWHSGIAGWGCFGTLSVALPSWLASIPRPLVPCAAPVLLGGARRQGRLRIRDSSVCGGHSQCPISSPHERPPLADQPQAELFEGQEGGRQRPGESRQA